MKKIMCLILAFTVLLSVFAMTGCEKENGNISDEMQEKYDYVVDNLNNRDKKTYKYLLALKDADYKDSEELYRQLYSWKARIYINDSVDATVDQSRIHIDGSKPAVYYIHFLLSGGKPEEEFRGEYEICFPDGYRLRDVYTGKDSGAAITIPVNAEQYAAGETVFTLYDGNNKPLGSKTVTVAVPENLGFTYRGTEIKLHADAVPILAVLGEPLEYYEDVSCAFDGLDKTYIYESFAIMTYPVGEKDSISCFWFMDDMVRTDEGISIGSAVDEVHAAYGGKAVRENNVFIVSDAGGELQIYVEDGYVYSIHYCATFE